MNKIESYGMPAAVLSQHTILLGKTGSGKSSVMRLLVEALLDNQKPVCILDPKGDWHGLRSSGDGKKAGYPVVIFGGSHADVPINDRSGTHVAELVATGNRPCIIDLGAFTVGERTRFFVDFSQTLFRLSRGPRWLVIDEVHNFCPQGKVQDPAAGKMLHWANRLASEGRGKGIQLLAASQRPQKVHKDFVTSCETLIAMRVIHPLDRNAIKEWIDGCPDADKGREVLASLASMPRGTGWAWSPEIGFGPKLIAFPRFSTYDSFAAPTGETVGKLKGWAEIDLDDVRAKLAAVVEEAKANDPAELKREIAELRKAATVPRDLGADKAALAAAEQQGYQRGRRELEYALKEVREYVSTVMTNAVSAAKVLDGRFDASPSTGFVNPVEARSRMKIQPLQNAEQDGHMFASEKRQKASTAARGGADSAVGTGGLRRIMIALAQRPGLTNRQIGVRAGISSKSGTFSTYLSKGRSSGWIRDEADRRFITSEGVTALGSFDPLPNGRELLDYWLNELGNGGAGRILKVAADHYPAAVSNAFCGQRAGVSHTSGTFSTYLSKLRTLELVTGRGEIRASDEFFK